MKILVIGTFPTPPTRHKWNFKAKARGLDPDAIIISYPFPHRLYLEWVGPLATQRTPIYHIDHNAGTITKVENLRELGANFNDFDTKDDTWFVYKEYNGALVYEHVMNFLENTR